jgi:hypothetical protein
MKFHSAVTTIGPLLLCIILAPTTMAQEDGVQEQQDHVHLRRRDVAANRGVFGDLVVDLGSSPRVLVEPPSNLPFAGLEPGSFLGLGGFPISFETAITPADPQMDIVGIDPADPQETNTAALPPLGMLGFPPGISQWSKGSNEFFDNFFESAPGPAPADDSLLEPAPPKGSNEPVPSPALQGFPELGPAPTGWNEPDPGLDPESDPEPDPFALFQLIFSESENAVYDGEDDENRRNELNDMIKNEIGTPPSASQVSQCKLIGFGSKPCGGPWSFLLYSTANTDEARLKELVSEYNQLETKINKAKQIGSTCSVPSLPIVGLVGGNCIATCKPNYYDCVDLP